MRFSALHVSSYIIASLIRSTAQAQRHAEAERPPHPVSRSLVVDLDEDTPPPRFNPATFTATPCRDGGSAPPQASVAASASAGFSPPAASVTVAGCVSTPAAAPAGCASTSAPPPASDGGNASVQPHEDVPAALVAPRTAPPPASVAGNATVQPREVVPAALIAPRSDIVMRLVNVARHGAACVYPPATASEVAVANEMSTRPAFGLLVDDRPGHCTAASQDALLRQLGDSSTIILSMLAGASVQVQPVALMQAGTPVTPARPPVDSHAGRGGRGRGRGRPVKRAPPVDLSGSEDL